MTIPIRLDQMSRKDIDPLEELLSLQREERDPLEELMATKVPGVAADATAALPRNRKGATGDLEAATAHPGEQAGSVLRGVSANVLNTAGGIPGVKALEAGAGAVGSRVFGDKPMSYRESLATLNEETDKIPKELRIAEQAIGGGLAGSVGKSLWRTGAVLAGGDVAGNADPDVGLKERAWKAPTAAVVGGLVGKGIEVAPTVARLVRSKNASANILEREGARKTAGSVNFPAAIQDGTGKATPAEIAQFLKEPDVTPIVARLSQTRKFQGVPPEDPRFLDQIYKELSDIGVRAGKTVEAGGANVNSKHLQQEEVGSAKQQLLGGMDSPQAAPLMPSYRKAVTEDATARGEERAFDRGIAASKIAGNKATPTPKQLRTLTPEALKRWAAQNTRSAAEKEALLQGAFGNARSAMVRKPLRSAHQLQGVHEIRQAVDPGSIDAFLQSLGVVNAPFANP